MGRLFYKPENAWVGDLIPYYENGTYYGFYLHDPRIRDKEYAEDTTWHLIETKDFVNLDYKGESIAAEQYALTHLDKPLKSYDFLKSVLP